MNQAVFPARTGYKVFSTVALCLLTAVAVLPTNALAQQQGYTSKYVNLRAGPSRDYPIVVTVPAGISLTVMGCVEGYRWCDVTVGSSRGWVYAGNIVYTYQGNNVPLLTYGPAIGIGITTFSVGSYWDNYYTGYPWYPQRQNWINRPYAYPNYGPAYGPSYAPGYNRLAPRAQVRPVAPPRQVRPAPQVRQPRNIQRAPQAQVRPVNPRQ